MKENITLFLALIITFSTAHYLLGQNNIPEYFGVDFHTSMEHAGVSYTGKKYDRYSAEKDDGWKKAKGLYDKYIVTNITYSEEPRIPKIIHQIWLGSPFPEKYKEFQKTWIDNHPDWEYKLWTDEDIEELGLYNHERYHATRNFGERSDIARYEILYRFGGLYVDTDFKCLKPFDIFHHCCDFYAGCNSECDLGVFIGIIGTIPNHPILQRCIKNISNKTSRTCNDVFNNTGPCYFTHCVLQELMECDEPWIIFPPTYFYPWPHWKRRENKPEEIAKWIKPETFAIHHWYVSWYK